MNKTSTRILIITLIILLLGVLIVLINENNKDQPFKDIVLPESSLVLNKTEYLYYDTIIKVGLNEIGLKDINLGVYPLSLQSKSNFISNGEVLKAHLREQSGLYYLFIENTNKNESISIISHELIHIEQYHTKKLIYGNGLLLWDQKPYDLLQIQYSDRPWEVEAFKKGRVLEEKLKNILF